MSKAPHAPHAGHVHAEILAQGRTLQQTARQLADLALPDWFERGCTPVFAGCGTSYYLAQTASAVARALSGRRASAVPAGDAWLYPEIHLTAETRPVLVAISRSGTTTETVLATGAAREVGIPSLGLSVDGGDLAAAVDDAILLAHAHERSVVMTQSYSNLLLVLHWVAAAWAGEAGREHLEMLASVARAVDGLLAGFDDRAAEVAAAGYDHFVFLGSGPMAGVAFESMLKMKEMTQIPVEAYQSLEFRHGPISTVRPGTLAVILSTARNLEHDLAVAADVRRLGGAPLVVAPGPPRLAAGEWVALPEGFDNLFTGSLAVPFTQLLAFHQTLAVGLDPDAPRHLSQVVVLPSQDPVRRAG